MFSTALYILIISTGGLVGATFFKKRYEELVPLTMFIIPETIFLFGLVDNLKLGATAVCIISALLYIICLRHILKSKDFHVKSLFTVAFFTFIAVIIADIYCMFGNVAYHLDEFSFWATSVKKMWFSNKLPCVPGANTGFVEYPPGMQLCEYLFLFLNGEYSEWRLYFVYQIFAVSLFLPFLKKVKLAGRPAGIIGYIVIIIVMLLAPSILFSYYCYTGLMVDCVLGLTFGFGIVNLFLYEKESGACGTGSVGLLDVNICACANMLVLIKSAGKLLAFLLILSWIIVSLNSGKNRKKLLLMLIPVSTCLLWKWKYSQAGVSAAFDEGSYDLAEFLAVLTGLKADGYRHEIRNSFVSYICTNNVQFGNINIPHVALWLILLALILLVLYKFQGNKLKKSIVFFIFIAGLVVYVLGLMASYMYAFSEGEGLTLASIDRYLCIYTISMLFVLLVMAVMNMDWSKAGSVWITTAAFVLVLSVCPFNTVKSLVLRDYPVISNSIANDLTHLKETIKEYRESNGIEQTENIIIVHQESTPRLPVYHFEYLMYPDLTGCNVILQTEFGSVPVAGQGGKYTLVCTAEEFIQYINEQNVGYIALDELNSDFIETYQSLFDSDLAEGQVYRVDGAGLCRLIK